jgi:hypothetical protein
MDTKYRLLQFDYWIQTILGVAILVCCLTIYGIYFGVLGLIPFGAVQVISGLTLSIVYRDKKRVQYLIFVAGFFLLWIASYTYGHSVSSNWIDSFNIVLCLIPPTLGVWYYKMTIADYNDLKKQQDEVGFSDEEVLDA